MSDAATVIEVTPEMIQQRVDHDVQEALARINVTDQVLAELKRDSDALTFTPIDTPERYELVRGLRNHAVSLRRITQKFCKSSRDEAILVQRTWVSAEKKVIAPIVDIENALAARALEWEQRQADIAREAQERKEAAERERFNALLSLGFMGLMADGNGLEDRYELGGTVLTKRDIIAADYETWANMLRSAQVVASELAEAKQSAAAAQQAEAAELQRKNEENAARELEINGRLNEVRRAELLQRGMQPGLVCIKDDNLFEYTTAAWDTLLRDVEDDIERRNTTIREAEARTRINGIRAGELIEQGMKRVGETELELGTLHLDIEKLHAYADIEYMMLVEEAKQQKISVDEAAERARAEAVRKAKEEKDRIAQEAVEAERKRVADEAERRKQQQIAEEAKKGDKQRYTDYITAIRAVPQPEITSAMGKSAMKTLGKYLDDHLRSILRDL